MATRSRSVWTAPPASTCGRWRTISDSGSASAATSRRCAGRGSGDFTLEQAISLDTVERDAQLAIDALIPLAEMLPAFASVTLTAEGVLRATHGRQLGPADTERGLSGRASSFVRLLDQSGQLVGIAEPVGARGAFASLRCSGVTC